MPDTSATYSTSNMAMREVLKIPIKTLMGNSAFASNSVPLFGGEAGVKKG